MAMAGVYKATKKDSTEYYRASFTYKNKHISLGSFDTMEEASAAYEEALQVSQSNCEIHDYSTYCKHLAFNKFVVIVNYRDKNIYIKTPIYLMNRYFIYYLSEDDTLTFDVDDLFYYSNHTIMRRQGHLFVADYGMQVNILSRYGIKNYAVCGKDYEFINGVQSDFRYGNIRIINKYTGVEHFVSEGRDKYRCKIHINGNYILGTYSSEEEAAVAYNKAISMLREKGVETAYAENYIEDISAIEYAKLFTTVKIAKAFKRYVDSL